MKTEKDFELGKPVVYKDGKDVISGEVIMNPSDGRLKIGGKWRSVSKGVVKGIHHYKTDNFIVVDDWANVNYHGESGLVNEAFVMEKFNNPTIITVYWKQYDENIVVTPENKKEVEDLINKNKLQFSYHKRGDVKVDRKIPKVEVTRAKKYLELWRREYELEQEAAEEYPSKFDRNEMNKEYNQIGKKLLELSNKIREDVFYQELDDLMLDYDEFLDNVESENRMGYQKRDLWEYRN